MERPLDLAAYLLNDQPSWTRKALEKEIATGASRRIALRTPVPIHVVYLTAWVGPDGQIQFRDDVYGRDEISLLNKTR